MLKIMDLKGVFIASVDKLPDGQLSIDVADLKDVEAVTELVQSFRHGKMYLIGGQSTQRGGQTIHETVRRLVSFDDPEFFAAVADWMARTKTTINGRRVRGLSVQDTR